ncbi:hypothetical protein SS50377_23758 [Spironucleus salmonicida]|uniref:Uncharacterized protein n=1 Tax=Spironucleus salmonicida TaxID=348837 RepID=V6LP31_9EUKA|nr:hypothetical protein SS50377_23758 [Spironucleus salmonicida]|eukprot:EST46437.1 Hypothetical protein SS50377_13522 [Spironucleus salmonicida]
MTVWICPDVFEKPDQNKLEFTLNKPASIIKFYYDPAITTEFLQALKISETQFSIDLTGLQQNVLCNVGFVEIDDSETIAYRCQFEDNHYILRFLK